MKTDTPESTDTTAAQTTRSTDYAIYKPTTRGTGGVFRFGLNPLKASVFVDAASQSGDKQFDWDHKITMKWGLSDIGQVLTTLQGRQTQTKLFHQATKANSAFELISRDDPEKAPYLMTLSRQSAENSSVVKVCIPLTHGEAIVLETLLQSAISRLVNW